jgi:cytochrome c oxidase subunit IV
MTQGHASRKTYWMVFAALAVLTVLEIIVATPSVGVPKKPMVLALITMAVSKAALVGLFFMHLKSEQRALKLTVALPFFFPALYAVILIAEAGWRLIR